MKFSKHVPACLCILALLLSFPTSFSSTAAQRTKRSNDGTIEGIVTDAQTGVPISNVYVSSQDIGDSSDANGHFTLPYQAPGLQKVSVDRRDYVPANSSVKVRPGRTARLNLKMRRALPAICKLAGVWSVEFTLVSPAQFGTRPTRKQTTGTMLFSPSFSSPFPWRVRPAHPADPTLDEYGSFDVDFRPFWGKQVETGGSTSIVGGKSGQLPLTEASGYVYAGDQVVITLIPRMSHGGVSLSGRVRGDTITGKWDQRAYSGGASGRFVMHRVKEYTTRR